MHYPMSDDWRQDAEREVKRRERLSDAAYAVESARFQELLRANLEAQGLTVTRLEGRSVDVTHPAGLSVHDDWYDRAEAEAFATMAAERTAAAAKGEQGAT